MGAKRSEGVEKGAREESGRREKGEGWVEREGA